jgi:hypothetical protein
MRKLFAAALLLLGIVLFGCVQPQPSGPQQMKDSAIYSLINADEASGVIYGEAYEEGIKELQSLSPLSIPANLNLIKNLKFVVTMPTFLSSAPLTRAGTAPMAAAIPVMITAAETPLGAKEFTALTQAFGGGIGSTSSSWLQNGSARFVEKTVLGKTIQVVDTSSMGAGPGMPIIDMVCVWKEGNELVSVSTLNCTGYIEKNLGKGSKEKFEGYIKSALDLKDKLRAKGKLFGIGAITIKEGAQGGDGGANAFGDANADYLQFLMKSPSIAQQAFYCSGSKETRGGREYCVDKQKGAPINLLSIMTKVGNHGLIMLVAVKGDESAAKETALAALDAAKLEGEPAKIGDSGAPVPYATAYPQPTYADYPPKPPEDISEEDLDKLVESMPEEPIDEDIAREVQ